MAGDTVETRDERLKRLYYRSKYTGTKETDLVLERFARDHLPNLSDAELDLYEEILEVGDPEIFAWVMKQKPVPVEYQNTVTELIIKTNLFD